MIEAHTGWTELALTHTVSGLETAAKFMQHVIANHGQCNQIRCDRASSFVNKFISSLSELLGVKVPLSASRNSQSNGRVERLVNKNKAAIKFHCEKDEDIELHLGSILLGLRSVRCKTTDCSAFYLRHGYDTPLPVLGSEPNDAYSPPRTLTSQERQFLETTANNLRQIQENVKQNIQQSKDTMKREYDKRESSLAVGMKVWLNNPQIKPHSANVLTHRGFNGPWFITDIIKSPTNEQGPSYRIVNAETGRAHKAPVPASRLKPCHDRESLIKRFNPEDAPPVSMQDAHCQSQTDSSDEPTTPTIPLISPSDDSSDSLPVTQKDQSTDVTDTSAAYDATAVGLPAPLEPAICIKRQRGRGKDSSYLVLFRNKECHWCNLSDISQELLRQWRLKQEKARRNRRKRQNKN
jgi:hypothetical protein